MSTSSHPSISSPQSRPPRPHLQAARAQRPPFCFCFQPHRHAPLHVSSWPSSRTPSLATRDPFCFCFQPHRHAPLPRVLMALKSDAVIAHQGPLPHIGFGSEHRRHLPHSVRSTLSVISSSIGPLLTVFPFPPSWQITLWPPESTAVRPPSTNTITSSMTRRHSASPFPPTCPTPVPHDAGARGADLIASRPPVSSHPLRHHGRPEHGDHPMGAPALSCWHGPARPSHETVG
jgi:hypothetical protein